MYTVCPKCALTLAVTAADLRAGQGYVRCGRCANVFNALLALSEESVLAAMEPPPYRDTHADADDAHRASGTVSRPALSDNEYETDEDSEPADASAPGADEPQAGSAPHLEPAPRQDPPPRAEPRPPVAPALRLVDTPPPPLPPPPALPDTPDDELEVREYPSTGTFETIVLEGDTFLQTEELIPQEVLDSEIADVSRRAAAPRDDYDEEAIVDFIVDTSNSGEYALGGSDLPRELAALREATGEFRHEANINASGSYVMPQLMREAPAVRYRGWMIAGSALLVLLLCVQAINHWRNDLATRAGWYGPLSQIAARFGEPLRPNWNLAAYDVRQLGAMADPGDAHVLRVRLSLANHGAQAQALPLLRLTLLDRYGKAVSSSELQPAQYLPAPLRGQQFIARDQRIDTEVRVQDPSQQASSFELDVCIAAAGGGVRCAGDGALVAGTP
jgi:predicted Zn finger-like uncharacterized protein